MPIKQIQLRGISRTPSDRAVADGGCAESLNVHLDQQETAPAQMPKNISETVYGNNARHPIVFIHKMTGMENHIAYDRTGSGSGRTISFYAYGGSSTRWFSTLFTSDAGNSEEFTMAASIGNTLIVYTDSKAYYFLFKDNAYTFLGNEIPRPGIEVLTNPVSDEGSSRYVTIEGGLNEATSPAAWNAAVSEENENHESLMATMENIWEEVIIISNNYRQNGFYSAPFFLRYALRLYDGSYVYSSTPILCGGSKEEWVKAQFYNDSTQDQPVRWLQVTMNNMFQVLVKGSYTAGNWSDIVKSIDFFASTPIYTPAIRAAFAKMRDNGYFVFDGMDDETREETIREAVLSKGQFYKIKSVDVNSAKDTTLLAGGLMRIFSSDDVSGEKLATHEEMADGYRDGITYIPTAETRNFNQRLMLTGVKENIAYGDMFLNGQVADGWTGSTKPNLYRYAFRYKVVDSSTGQPHYVVSRYYNGDTIMTTAYKTSRFLMHGDENRSDNQFTEAIPYAWLCYPDTRCKEVEISFYDPSGYSYTTKKIAMEPHPYLECAYAFLGMGKNLRSILLDPDVPSVTSSFDENRTIESGNKLLLSEFSNPFLFPAGNIMTFSDKLVGTALTSVPLSEGQFGEFPLYVFTEGGIRMLLTTHEGTFAVNMTPPNLSRHVALPGTILSLEQAIVFITEKGVMMLTGSSVTDLSQNMNGRPETYDYGMPNSGQASSEMHTLIYHSPQAALLYALTDASPFMAFMRTAKVAYDSKGARFIFFSSQKAFQYVYKLDTQTWHKIATGIQGPTILNAFPECFVSRSVNGAGEVWDFSTALHDADLMSRTENSVKGVIATRPFDLGEPDIRKTIRSIRIRGDYDRNNVKYILLGSFDNIHWKRLVSLRGGSYKSFRLVILTDLTYTERITWIDVDYEARMTNRLR